MHLLCLIGMHKFDKRFDSDHISPMGNPAPRFLRCRVCGHEKDLPVFKEHPNTGGAGMGM